MRLKGPNFSWSCQLKCPELWLLLVVVQHQLVVMLVVSFSYTQRPRSGRGKSLIVYDCPFPERTHTGPAMLRSRGYYPLIYTGNKRLPTRRCQGKARMQE